MREHVRQLITTSQPNHPVDLGAETVRLAQIAAAIHAAEAAKAIAQAEQAEIGALQEQFQ